MASIFRKNGICSDRARVHLALALLIGFAPGTVVAEVVRKNPPKTSEAKKKAEEKPAKPAPKKAAAPKDAETDAESLETLRFRFQDWTDAGASTSDQGLRFEAKLVPDAIAFKVAEQYLRFRDRGMDHPAAVVAAARSMPRWKRYDSRALFLVTLKNEKPEVEKDKRRIFTLEKRLDRDGVRVQTAKKKRIPLKLGTIPQGTRTLRLRVKRHWTTADGRTRRARGSRVSRRDPASVGRKPVLSDPVTALVIQAETAHIELLASKKVLAAARSTAFSMSFPAWKRYEGPFTKGLIDLNHNRTWDTIRPVGLTVRVPPAGLHVPAEVQKLLGEVRKAAKILAAGQPK